VQLVQKPQGSSIEAIAQRSMRDAGFRQLEGGRRSLNGLDGYVGTYEGRMEQIGDVRVRAAHIAHQRLVFLVAGVAPRGEYEPDERAFVSTIGSFRPLSQNEAVNVRPNRLDFHTVAQGETWQSIAARQGGSNVPAATLAIMNGFAPSQQPPAGTRIKIVVGG
jgi:predicted Zn-dependent protease